MQEDFQSPSDKSNQVGKGQAAFFAYQLSTIKFKIMRAKPIIPRILKIDKIDGFKIVCTFNNGQRRLLDFNKIFEDWVITERDAEHKLLNVKEFSKVKLRNNTLSWPNVSVMLMSEDGNEKPHPYELSPDELFEFSEPMEQTTSEKFGGLIRTARLKSGLTQEQLAQKSGTTRFYISRLENDRTDIQLSTFRKIVEAGLGRRFTLKID